MIWNLNRIVIVGLLASLFTSLTGCNPVLVDAPIGQTLDKADESWFVGSWIIEGEEKDGYLEIRQRKDRKLIGGTLNWDDERGEYSAQSFTIEVRRVGTKAIYLFVKGDEEDWYSFARAKRLGDSTFELYLPDSDLYREAVEAGDLKGEVEISKADVPVPANFDAEAQEDESDGNCVASESFTVRLDSKSKELQALLASENVSKFELKEVTTYRRLNSPKTKAKRLLDSVDTDTVAEDCR